MQQLLYGNANDTERVHRRSSREDSRSFAGAATHFKNEINAGVSAAGLTIANGQQPTTVAQQAVPSQALPSARYHVSPSTRNCPPHLTTSPSLYANTTSAAATVYRTNRSESNVRKLQRALEAQVCGFQKQEKGPWLPGRTCLQNDAQWTLHTATLQSQP